MSEDLPYNAHVNIPISESFSMLVNFLLLSLSLLLSGLFSFQVLVSQAFEHDDFLGLTAVVDGRV